MYEVIFLVVLALVWIISATIQDIRKREVANWLNFSLIIFALGFRFFHSLFASDSFMFFYQGLIGLAIFFVIGNLLYHIKLFAGGDAKLMIALGPVLPFSESFFINLNIFFGFIVLFLIVGGIYGIFCSVVLTIRNFKEFKKEFKKQLQKKKKLYSFIMIIGLIIMLLGFIESLLFILGILIFIFPYFYLYAKSVEESCMVKKVSANKLVEGDWLYKDVKVGKHVIKTNWEGLSEKEIKLLKKRGKKVLIKQGIAFVPVFLISFVLLVFFQLWNPFWQFYFFA